MPKLLMLLVDDAVDLGRAVAAVDAIAATVTTVELGDMNADVVEVSMAVFVPGWSKLKQAWNRKAVHVQETVL